MEPTQRKDTHTHTHTHHPSMQRSCIYSRRFIAEKIYGGLLLHGEFGSTQTKAADSGSLTLDAPFSLRLCFCVCVCVCLCLSVS